MGTIVRKKIFTTKSFTLLENQNPIQITIPESM